MKKIILVLSLLISANVCAQGQVPTLIKRLISKATITDDRSEANDFLTKATALCESVNDEAQKNKFLTQIQEAVDIQQKKDKTALESKIREFFNGAIPEHKTYENCIEIMVYNVLSSRGSLSAAFENKEQELFAEIILGTPKRNMEDGLWARIKDAPDVPAGTAALVQLVFLCANDKVLYQGATYEPSKLLTSLFDLNVDTYNKQFLDAVNSVGELASDHSIEMFSRDFSIEDIIPNKEAFKKIEFTTFKYLK